MKWEKLIDKLLMFCLSILILIFLSLSNLEDYKITQNSDSSLNDPDIKYQQTQVDIEKREFSLHPLAKGEEIKINSESLTSTHLINDQERWINKDVEEYLILNYTQPMLKNTDIKGIQMILQQLKLYTGKIDGVYGPKTMLAVQAYQKLHNLDPTGIVDLDDYKLLSQSYEESIPVLRKGQPNGKVSILIVLDERSLYVLNDGEFFHKFPIAIGTPELPSPIGNWKIITKDRWGGGFGSHWLGINVPYGKYGIHGTNKPWSIGRAESHGCFRMFNRDIELLYKWATWGTRVSVIGGNFPYNLPWRTLKEGDRSFNVWQVQNRLRELGYYPWRPDGVFGLGTKHAVEKFQKENNLVVDGKVGWIMLSKLGLGLFQ